jgi:hypothetical protein
MIRKYLALILLLTASLCSAQKGEFSVGFMAGPLTSNLTQNIIETTPHYGFMADAHVLYGINSRFDVYAGLGYTMRGYNGDITYLDTNSTFNGWSGPVTVYSTLHYLDVPVKLYYHSLKKMELVTSLGLTPAFILASHRSVKLGPGAPNSALADEIAASSDFPDQYSRFNLFASVGAGTGFQKGKFTYLLMLQYDYGLLTVVNPGIGIHNAGVQFMVNYRIM